MTLSEDQKARIRYHLGNPNVELKLSLSLGVPAVTETGFILESAMNNLIAAGVPKVLQCLENLECIEVEMSAARRPLTLTSVGSTHFRGPEANIELEEKYRWWQERLADSMGVIIEPFAYTTQRWGSGAVMEPN